jgi:guanylate kinase
MPAPTEHAPPAHAWLTSSSRLRMLREAGARVIVGKTYRGARDVRARLSFDIGVFDDPETESVEALRIAEAA